MRVKKILIVPADSLIEERPESPLAAFFLSALRHLERSLGKTSMVYNGELQFYADMPKILGRENVFVFGQYHPHFYSEKIPAFSAYPSCHGVPPPTCLEAKEAQRAVAEADILLVSVLAGKRGEMAIEEARKRGRPVAMIDFKDHPSIFGGAEAGADLCRGFQKGKHYNLYFKKDLPLGCGTDSILALAPIPVRPESYKFDVLNKDTDIFYSGRPRIKGVADREEIVASVRDNFSNVLLLDHGSQKTFVPLKEYWDDLARARIALSPSGTVWDSARHCEAGLAPQTALLAPMPCIETAGPPLKDGVNAILYEMEFRGGRYHLIHREELVEKIKHYLTHPSQLIRIAEAWAREVRSGHTVLARSRYLIESMEKAL